MPLYEYQCEGCGDVFEVMQKFTDDPLTIHEKCGGQVHRLMSAPALQFKGSGWYITDYAKASKSQPNGGAQKGEGSKSDGPSKSSGSSPGSTSPTSGSSGSSPSGSSSDKK